MFQRNKKGNRSHLLVNLPFIWRTIITAFAVSMLKFQSYLKECKIVTELILISRIRMARNYLWLKIVEDDLPPWPQNQLHVHFHH